MASPLMWNVLFPVNLLKCSSGYCTGHIVYSQRTVLVTCVLSYDACQSTEFVVGEFTTRNRADTRDSDFLDRRSTENKTTASSSTCRPNSFPWLKISSLMNNVISCELFLSEKSISFKCLCILFEPIDILSSYSLADQIEKNNKNLQRDCVMSVPLPVLQDKAKGDESCTFFPSDAVRPVTLLASIFYVYHEHYGKYHQTYNKNVTDHQGQGPKQKTLMIGHVLFLILGAIELLLTVISFRWLLRHLCTQCPAAISNISQRLNRFKSLRSLSSQAHKSQIVFFDVCGQQLLDSFLGILLMLLVIHSGLPDALPSLIVQWADDTANYLNKLLHWLMGAPAGLKLNAQLTEYMGHFFLYHVYLWSSYLHFLQPRLTQIILMVAGFGVFGLSIQLCLVQDVISMLTLHIYCFYVYAARLHSLQMHTLSSLWRLFRGKKWNVLRLRVDSAQYSLDQLCVGTILFTALLFLLPTTLLYYAVFTALRLLVLSFHGALTLATETLSSVPVASVLLRLFRSKLITGDILFEVESRGLGSSDLVLAMKATHTPLAKVYRLSQSHMSTNCSYVQQKYSWSELCNKILQGSLVYPWIDSQDSCPKKA